MAPDIWFGTKGPRNADVVLVGEAFGREEAAVGLPFVGQSGQELDRLLLEAGLDPNKIFFTNVVAARPDNNEMWRFFQIAKGNSNPPVRHLHPEPIVYEGLRRLAEQISAVRPKVVIAAGNYALWALTNCTTGKTNAESEGRRVPSGIGNWRGSMWYCDALPGDLAQIKCLPITHPAAIMRAWYERAPTKHDLQVRVPMALADDWRPNPSPVFWAPPTFEQARDKLIEWHRRLDSGEKIRLQCDIETAKTLITTIGFCDGPMFAMSVPFIQLGRVYFEDFWPADQERILGTLIWRVLSHPNALVEGQNFIYDTQYLIPFLGCSPNFDFDTMLAHHLLFPGTPKGLDYLSSLYCRYHWYWKDDGKEWNLRGGLPTLLAYNCMDLIRQYESATELRSLITQMGQDAQWEEEKEKHALALRMMLRGVLIDRQRRADLALELMTTEANFAQWFNKILPQEVVTPETKNPTPWFRSTDQQRYFFGEVLGLNLPKHRKTGNDTFGKEALDHLTSKHPEFSRIFEALRDYRSVGVFHNTFVKAGLDPDDRMRCSYNPAGTETFRWSSSKNAFGRGTNLQNIPEGTED